MKRTSDTRVVCPVCDRSYAPLKSGLLKQHWQRREDGTAVPFGDPCAESGQAPARERAKR